MLLDDDAQWTRVTGEVAGDIDSDNDESNNTSDDEGVGEVTVHPESQMVSLPSSLVPGEIQRLGLTTIAGQEEKLRCGQVNDALEGLRLALRAKSLLLRTHVQNVQSQRTTQRAWKDVNKEDAEARHHKQSYDSVRHALRRLQVDQEYLNNLQEITEDDMKMSGDVTEENRVGQCSSTLAWFWRLGSSMAIEETEINPVLKECEPQMYSWIEVKLMTAKFTESIG